MAGRGWGRRRDSRLVSSQLRVDGSRVLFQKISERIKKKKSWNGRGEEQTNADAGQTRERERETSYY